MSAFNISRNQHHSLLPRASAIADHQAALVATPGWPLQHPPMSEQGLMRWVVMNHRYNALLWAQEDQARRLDAPDHEIVANKRAIDRYNQLRNDAIEMMDEIILTALPLREAHPEDPKSIWFNSETAASIIDRLSIGCLKLHHMGLQTTRPEVTAEHRRACLDKVKQLQAQRQHLIECLDNLLDGMQTGRCSYKTYRQFKMYNDPTLNPYLYQPRPTRDPKRACCCGGGKRS